MKNRYYFIVVFLILSLFQSIFANPIGIITAVPSEAKYIEKVMQYRRVIKRGIYHYELGYIDKKPVALLVGGAAIVNAAISTTEMIEQFNPPFILFSGTAGAIANHLNVGDVIIVKQSYAFDTGNPNSVIPKFPDFPKNPATGQRDLTLFPANHILLALAKSLSLNHLSAQTPQGNRVSAHVLMGSMATTDHFPNNQQDYLRMKKLGVDATAMETASMMKVCRLFNKPCLAFRGISDLIYTKKPNQYTKWNKQNEHLAAHNAATVVISFIQHANPNV